MEYNRLLAYRQTKRNWDIHEEKIKSVKPTFNTRNSSFVKPKNTFRKYGQLNRILDVQFQNKALLKKLTKCRTKANITITGRPLKLYKNKQILQGQERSLENKGLVKRIKNIKPSYNTQEYLKEYKENQKHAHILCKYGYKGQKPTKTYLNMEMTNDIDKYIDLRKSRSPQADCCPNENENEKKLNKIIQIHEEKSIRREDEDFKVRVVEMEDSLLIQVVKGLISFNLELNIDIFEQKYGRKVNKLLKALKYDKKKEEFYLL